MQQQSKPVRSTQKEPHPNLAKVVQRHLTHASHQPLLPASRSAFTALRDVVNRTGKSLILDSFCGTGHSTVALAEQFPQHVVVGIDQSARRLNKHPPGHRDNYLLLHARCEDIWRLLVGANMAIEHHYLLYPNPWPKPNHLQRRVHGHASFSTLLQLGGALELRSNWQLYVEEFQLALGMAGINGVIGQCDAQPPLSLFEKKYQESGHSLWRCNARLTTPATHPTNPTTDAYAGSVASPTTAP